VNLGRADGPRSIVRWTARQTSSDTFGFALVPSGFRIANPS
jgi:hypothetical protein